MLTTFILLVTPYLSNMVSNMPLPIPPRTPTPPPDEVGHQPVGLGFESQLSPTKLGFNSNALSPLSATFPSDRYGTLGPSDSTSQRATPSTVFSPASATFPFTPASAVSAASDIEAPSLSGSENVKNPFNFQPMQYMPGKPQANKSVSMRLFGYEIIG